MVWSGLVPRGVWGDWEVYGLEVTLGWLGVEIDPATGAGKEADARAGPRGCPAQEHQGTVANVGKMKGLWHLR